MIRVDTVQQVHTLRHEQGKTYEQIQAELGLSSKTIAKALLRPEEILDGYQRTALQPRPVLGPVTEKIEELLRGKDWAQEKGRKIRRTARWVWRQLKKDGFEGAESTVRSYIREKLKLPRPACPIEHFPAREAQFDFGQSIIKIGDVATLVHFVGAIFPYSTRRFLYAYPAERQECLFDAMERVYQRAGGLTEVATLDNTKCPRQPRRSGPILTGSARSSVLYEWPWKSRRSDQGPGGSVTGGSSRRGSSRGGRSPRRSRGCA